MNNKILNLQQYEAIKQQINLLPYSDERALLTDCANRLDMLLHRIYEYNRLPWYKRLFKDI